MTNNCNKFNIVKYLDAFQMTGSMWKALSKRRELHCILVSLSIVKNEMECCEAKDYDIIWEMPLHWSRGNMKKIPVGIGK